MALVLLAFLAGSALAADARTPRQRRAEEHAVAAHVAFEQGDVASCWKLVEKSLRKDPQNLRARYLRGAIFAALAFQEEDGKRQAEMFAVAKADFAFVAKGDPNGVLGGIARGFLTGKGEGRPSLDVPPVACPEAATTAFNTAELAFSRHDFATARVAYLLAIESCPQDPTFHVYLGDAYFADGDRAEAMRRYEHALVIDPCNWQALRFMADHEVKIGEPGAAYGHLVEAMACNPNYAEGRGSLAQVVATGSVPIRWPDVPPQVRQVDAGEPWTTLAAERARALAAGATPMDAERAAVKATLVAWRAAPTANEAFRLLSDAEAAGTLDHAIYALLLDRPLFPEFLAWRATHRPELAAYIRASLATYP